MSASTLFNQLRREFTFDSDAALARWLEVGPPDISKAREKGSISDRMILRVHECSGWSTAEIRVLLGQMDLHQYHDNPAQVSATEATQ